MLTLFEDGSNKITLWGKNTPLRSQPTAGILGRSNILCKGYDLHEENEEE